MKTNKLKLTLIFISSLWVQTFAQDIDLVAVSSGEKLKLGIVESSGELSDSVVSIISRDLSLPGMVEIFTNKDKPSPFWQNDGMVNYISYKITQDKTNKINIEFSLKQVGSDFLLMKDSAQIKKSEFRKYLHSYSNKLTNQFFALKGSALSKIAFVTHRTGHKEIALMDYDGANQRVLTNHKSISSFPSISPDFSKIYYSSFIKGYSSLYVFDLKAKKHRTLLAPGLQAYGPKVSNMGHHLLFTLQEKGNVDVYRMRLSDRKIFRITALNSGETSPDWGIGDQEIFFTSDRGGKPQIYRMDIYGSGMERITYSGAYNESATLSPNGQTLAFCRMIGGQMKIFVKSLITGDEMLLNTGFGNYESPSWSPDGKMITFSSDRTGSSQVYLMRADGTGMFRLTTRGKNTSPSWSTSGQK
ncbi:hypothetical protein OAA91_01410 [Fibrobacterales bacterium]|nr:hypothetical protein [Fibrobacterales bacterium]